MTPGTKELPILPRFGMRMDLPGAFEHLQWLGLCPRETGNKTGVRWLALRNDKGVGLLVLGDTLLSASALNFTQEDPDEGPMKNQ